jgi:hypothetical protein
MLTFAALGSRVKCELPATKVKLSSIVLEPIAVTEDFYAGVAYELNRAAEGIDTRPVSAVASVEASARSDATVLCDDFELGMLVELGRIVERTETDMDDVLDAATGDELAAAMEMAVDSPSSRPMAELPWPVVAPSAASQLPERQVASLPNLPWPVFAPDPENKQPHSRIASYGLPQNSIPRARLGQAVSLTRDALYAWIHVLTDPALVEVTAR